MNVSCGNHFPQLLPFLESGNPEERTPHSFPNPPLLSGAVGMLYGAVNFIARIPAVWMQWRSLPSYGLGVASWTL